MRFIMRTRSACHLLQFILFVLFVVGTLSGDVSLSCDEFEHQLYLNTNDAFCTVTGLVVTHSQNVVVTKYPPSNRAKFMKFYDSTLLSVPFHLFETFVQLKTLDMSYTSILELTRNTFSAASNLTYLNLSYNNLTSVQTSVFIGANALMRLDLSYNRISQLSENAFCGLHILNKLQLDGNRLTDLHKDIFKDNEYLESVSFDSNRLTFVQPEVFSRLRRIKDVNLANNQLIRVHPDTFTEAANLDSLFLVGNALDSFQLTNKNIAHQLHLDANHLTTLTVNGTHFVTANYNNISLIRIHQPLQLETLEVRGNRLSNIVNITRLTSLLHLDISYNPIGPLNVSTFSQLKRLRQLQLRSNGIQQLEFGMFSKQTNLETLELSFNNLTNLNLDMFVPYMNNLKEFFVDGNMLSEVQGNRSFAQAFPVLQKLGISRNRFNCSYLHHLLTPPYLIDSVVLHIEPDDRLEETPHIRDVSCISSSTNSASPQAKWNAQVQMEPDLALHKQLELLRAHSENLELHLLFMKIFFYIIGILLLIAVAALVLLYYRKAQRSGRYNRSSIVFHSNATMDANSPLGI